jgi:hypothetical protein
MALPEDHSSSPDWGTRSCAPNHHQRQRCPAPRHHRQANAAPRPHRTVNSKGSSTWSGAVLGATAYSWNGAQPSRLCWVAGVPPAEAYSGQDDRRPSPAGRPCSTFVLGYYMNSRSHPLSSPSAGRCTAMSFSAPSDPTQAPRRLAPPRRRVFCG